jgi:flagellar motor switch protein FliN
MAAESGPMDQNEIEQILKQAQSATGASAMPGEAPPKTSDASTATPATASGATSSSVGSEAARAAVSSSAQNPAMAQGDIDFLLNQAEQALASINTPAPGDLPSGVKPFKLPDFASGASTSNAATLDLIRDVELDLRIELGRTHMHLEDVLKLSKGSVVTLDKLAGDPVDVFVNGRLIARAEVLILNENFCVRVAELMAPEATHHPA